MDHFRRQEILNIVIPRINDYIKNNTDPRIIILRYPTIIQWIFKDLSFLSLNVESNTIKENKKLEDTWGSSIMKECYPKHPKPLKDSKQIKRLKIDPSLITEQQCLENDQLINKQQHLENDPSLITEQQPEQISKPKRNQWSGTFGEKVITEICILRGETILEQKRYKQGKGIATCKPDIETDKNVIEVKTGTYFTSGTSHDKIPSIIFKYSNISELSGKPVKAVMLGRAASFCSENGLFPKCSINESVQKVANKFNVIAQDYHIEYIPAKKWLADLVTPSILDIYKDISASDIDTICY